MKPKILLVDGHSMIFQWPELHELQIKRAASAREALIRILNRLQDASDYTIAVVFDGKGPVTSKEAESSSIQIFYSKDGKTADSIIERLTAKYAAIYDVLVATDDHMERQTVIAFGGTWLSSEMLKKEVESADSAVQEALEKLKRKNLNWNRAK